MKQFIIVGGPTRSGTNTVSLFLHLHQDVVSFGSAEGLHPMNQLKDFYKELALRKNALQTEGVLQGYDNLRKYLTHKNVELRNNMVSTLTKDIMVLRFDYGEAIFPVMLGLLPSGVRLKMITCLRPLDLVFRSQFLNRHAVLDDEENKARQLFKQRIENSFTQLEHLNSKLSESILFVDITSEDAPEYYMKILRFLDLQINKYQLEWIEKLPITNRTDWEAIGNPQYGGDFEELETMRKELLI